ncbi:MAG: TolC family protein [Elusimicrobiales bacterium]|nr:TolC family protein [Elusimicrobiales bacterium]
MRKPGSKTERSLKDDIRRAAIKLFAERGMENVAVRDIVREAGTTQPMLYYYFGSKDALCLCLFRDLLLEVSSGVGEVLKTAGPLDSKMEALFTFYRDFFASHPGTARFILQGFMSPQHRKEFAAAADAAETEHREAILRMLKEHERKGELKPGRAEAILELMDGIFTNYMFNSKKTERPRAAAPGRLAALICKGACALLVPAMLLAAPAAAQEQAAGAEPWTLERCLTRAMEINPSIQAAREGVIAAKGQNLMAISEFVPRVNWNSVYIDNSYVPSPGASRASYGDDAFYLSTLSADLNVFSWRMAPLRRTMKANTKVAALKLAGAQNDLTLNVKKAFFTSLYAKQLLTISQAAEAVAKENLETSQALYKEGKVSTFDVSRASVRYVNARTSTISARNTQTVALENLRLLLSLEPGETMEIEGEFPEEPLETPLTEQLSSALARRPELHLAKAAEELQISARELARAGFLPTVFAGFSYSWEGREFAPGSRSGDYKYWTAKAGVSIPLFDGLFSIGRYKAQKAGVAQAKEQSRAAADGVVMEVRQHYYALANSKESLGAQKENVETAAENLRIAQERYKMGLLSLLDLKDAELSIIDARTQQIKTLYDYNVARTSLERAVGLPAAAN